MNSLNCKCCGAGVTKIVGAYPKCEYCGTIFLPDGTLLKTKPKMAGQPTSKTSMSSVVVGVLVGLVVYNFIKRKMR